MSKRVKAKEEKKRDPNAPWLSVWVLTYNTNRTSSRYIKIVDEAWKQVISNIVKYVRPYSSDTITLISVREFHAVERGDKYHKIHIHSNLEIDSFGLSMLDYTDMAEDMDDIIHELYLDEYGNEEDYTPYTRGYLNGQIVLNANAARKIMAYLGKAPLIGLLGKAPPIELKRKVIKK